MELETVLVSLVLFLVLWGVVHTSLVTTRTIHTILARGETSLMDLALAVCLVTSGGCIYRPWVSRSPNCLDALHLVLS